MTPRILVVDDDTSMCDFLQVALTRHGFAVQSCVSSAEALRIVEGTPVDVVLTDLNMPGMNGLDLCQHLASALPDVPVIVITAFGSLEAAIAAIRLGAYDFITKPLELEALVLVLERAVQHRRLRDEVQRLRTVVEAGRQFEGLLGSSPAMRRLYDLLERVGDSDASVLISGESGTGKELVARALHRRSRRREGPFVPINCAAVPEALIESELFGHARGAFTDARVARPGLLSQANGGTLFLDEIADLPIALQPKLLRALQERRVRPVGSDAEVPVDLRLVCATNRDLETAVSEGRFREDLYFRINVIHVGLPALRTRGSDVLLLAQHFVLRAAARVGKRVTGISAEAAERLLAYTWPGNVRELENCMEHAVALTEDEHVAPADLPERVRSYRPSHVVVAADDPSELVSMEEVERRYVRRVMQAVGGNKTLAARILGFDRKTLYRKLGRYGEPEGD